MMAAFNVSVLADFDYNETNYVDPMETEYRAKKEAAGVYDRENVKARVEFMGSFEPYDHVDEVDGWLESYWKTHDDNAVKTSTSSVSVTSSSSSDTVTTKPATTSKAMTTSMVTTTSKADDKTTKTSTSSSTTKTKGKRDFVARYAPVHPRRIPRRTAVPEVGV
jgi:hypothetical protein